MENIEAGILRLAQGLAHERKTESKMYFLLLEALKKERSLFIRLFQDSIIKAKNCLEQDRSFGSSATLIFPIETAIRLVAKRHELVRDPLSPEHWDCSKVIDVVKKHFQEIIDLSGANTTSLNLPHRAGHVLWLIDQIEAIPQQSEFSFLEIGASSGLILDGLQMPNSFNDWMRKVGYRTDFGTKQKVKNKVRGIDLVVPTLEWAQAIIPGEPLRNEVVDFINSFSRSSVIQGDATTIHKNKDVVRFFKESSGIPFIYSCCVFYQIPLDIQVEIKRSAQLLLQRLGGGYFMVTDFARNVGYPQITKGSISHVENQYGDPVSPKILTTNQELTNWEIIEDTIR